MKTINLERSLSAELKTKIIDYLNSLNEGFLINEDADFTDINETNKTDYEAEKIFAAINSIIDDNR